MSSSSLMSSEFTENVYFSTLNVEEESTSYCDSSTKSTTSESSSGTYIPRKKCHKYILIRDPGKYYTELGSKYLVITEDTCTFVLPEYQCVEQSNLEELCLQKIVIKAAMGNHIVKSKENINYYYSTVTLNPDKQVGEFFAQGSCWKVILY